MPHSLLITGGAGFIGSCFLPFFCQKYADHYRIICLDLLTYAGSISNIPAPGEQPNLLFEKGDICDTNLMPYIFSEYDIRGVINFAAETHVDNSIRAPARFFRINVTGTVNLLEAARSHWMDPTGQPKPGYENARFHQISTDEVYGSLGKDGLFTESSPYAPSSPYSASKAAADMAVRAYHRTYGMNVTISCCSNNFGPRQHQEKFIPHVIECALNEESIPVYGSGLNVRDWLYVTDHCTAVDLIFHRGTPGETYNIGCGNERTNISMAQLICRILDCEHPRKNGRSYADLITHVTDRAGHDLRYALDSTKLTRELGWQSHTDFEQALRRTVIWYLRKFTRASQS